MRRYLTGLALSLVASASFAQSQITFDVDFHTVYAASGNFAPSLVPTGDGPFNPGQMGSVINLQGSVVLTTNVSSAKLTPNGIGNPPGENTLTLNGSWSSESGNEPSNTWSTHTYDSAVYDFGTDSTTQGYVAVDFVSSGNDWPLLAGTAVDGFTSDHGPASLYSGTCPFFFGCQSANPFNLFPGGTTIFDTGTQTALFPEYADSGFLPQIGGTYTPGGFISSLSSSNGLDAIAFDFTLLGGQVPGIGGTVRFLVFSDTASTAYMIEGTIVPVPAAVWLFGSALGLLGWVRRRATV